MRVNFVRRQLLARRRRVIIMQIVPHLPGKL
jgi:hypothetical protein